MDIKKEFSKNKITKSITTYEIFYQITLGFIVKDTKTEDLDPNVDLQMALSSIYELIMDIKDLDDSDEIFESELRKQAAMDALQNFTNAHLQVVKEGLLDIEPMINNINDNNFFDETMLQIAQTNYATNLQKWESLITDEIASAIMNSLEALNQ